MARAIVSRSGVSAASSRVSTVSAAVAALLAMPSSLYLITTKMGIPAASEWPADAPPPYVIVRYPPAGPMNPSRQSDHPEVRAPSGLSAFASFRPRDLPQRQFSPHR